jgi:hypothetical protein
LFKHHDTKNKHRNSLPARKWVAKREREERVCAIERGGRGKEDSGDILFSAPPLGDFNV